MIKFLSKVTLIAISSFGFFYSSQASENTIEGYQKEILLKKTLKGGRI